MATFPQDCEERKTGSKGRKILHYKLNSDHWDYHEETGNDYGRDCILELSEDDEWRNHKIEGQIKGTAKPKEIVDGKYISFPMELKTLRYALNSSIAFVIFVVDTTTEYIYYQPIQEYFIKHKDLFSIIEEDEQKTLNIRIPKENLLSDDEDGTLQILARTVYVGGCTSQLAAHFN